MAFRPVIERGPPEKSFAGRVAAPTRAFPRSSSGSSGARRGRSARCFRIPATTRSSPPSALLFTI
jgi:hypothetical protein